MKKSLLIILCLLIFGAAHSQNTGTDSLLKLVSSLKAPASTKAQNPDSILRKLFSIKSPAARIKAMYDIITPDYSQLKFDRALYYYRKILEGAKKNNDPIIEAVITGEQGFILAQNGDYAQGIKMLSQALTMAQKTDNKQAIGTVYYNLGAVYIGEPKVNIAYYKKGLQYSTAAENYPWVAATLGQIGLEFASIHRTDSANYYLVKGIRLAVQRKLVTIAQIYLPAFGSIQTDPKVRINLLKAVLKMDIFRRDPIYKSNLSAWISYAYRGLKAADSALYYAKLAYKDAGSGFLTNKIAPAKMLAEAYKGHNADSALKYTEIYYQWRDSMFNIDKTQRAQTMAFAEQQHQQEIAAEKVAYNTSIRLYLMVAVILFLLVMAFVFYRNNQHKQRANVLLGEQKEEIEAQRDNLENALHDLTTTQQQLVQSEKMASLGELTAGIAHEIQNPLNFVNNFSEVSVELLDELKEEAKKGNTDDVLAIADDLTKNLKKITHHGKRADSIVKGMLQHSRASSGHKEPANINKLADEYLRLAYHGLRAKDKLFNAELITHFDQQLPKVNIIPQDIGRVLLNLFTNAFYAVQQKQKTAATDYQPTVTLTTYLENNQATVKVKDNGSGIPDEIKDKVMQPFFTTKPTGEGTGLGLSLSYDIVVKGHGGQLSVDSVEGQYSVFEIKLPFN